MSAQQIIGWLVLGLLAGAIAKALMPGSDRSGLFATILLGIAGAFVGGWLGSYTGFLPRLGTGSSWAPAPGSLITATVGTIVLLAIYRWLRR
jgi:uncharacterized membrane protein YeaQ/YmgE (transglycosylase-associated protein family)